MTTDHDDQPISPPPLPAPAEQRLRDIRHAWGYVRRYLDNTGGPTLKIHLARLEGALAEPEPAGEPATADVQPDPLTALEKNHELYGIKERFTFRDSGTVIGRIPCACGWGDGTEHDRREHEPLPAAETLTPLED